MSLVKQLKCDQCNSPIVGNVVAVSFLAPDEVTIPPTQIMNSELAVSHYPTVKHFCSPACIVNNFSYQVDVMWQKIKEVPNVQSL